MKCLKCLELMMTSVLWICLGGCRSDSLSQKSREDLFYPMTIDMDSLNLWDAVSVARARELVNSTKPHPRSLQGVDEFRWFYLGTEEGYYFFSRERRGEKVAMHNFDSSDDSWIAMKVKVLECNGEIPQLYKDAVFGNIWPYPVFNFTDEAGVTSYQWDRFFGFDYEAYKSISSSPDEIERINARGLDYSTFGFSISYNRIEFDSIGAVFSRKLLFIPHQSEMLGPNRLFACFAVHNNGDKFYFRCRSGDEAVYIVPGTTPEAFPVEYKKSIRSYLDVVWVRHNMALQSHP